MYRVYHYPNCSTCKKALKWLRDNNVDFELVHIVDDVPMKESIEKIHELSALPIKKLFNTSGKRYRELNMKDKVNVLSQDDLFKMLSEDGMLLKRPIITNGEIALIGFKIEEWEKYIK